MSDDLKRRLRANRGEHSAINVLSSLTDQKVSSRYPMRSVPDIPGFRTLTKQEVKRDVRDVEKHVTFMHNNNNDSDDEATGYVMSSMNPPCGDESHLLHKFKRLEKWKSNPNLKNKELDFKRNEVNKAKKELDDLISQEDRWFFYLQLARLKLTESLMQCRDRNNHLVHDNKQLYNLSINECGPSNRKRRSLAIRDILDDLVERENLLTSKINEYERVVAEAAATNTKYAGGFTLPITSISVDELDYEEDTKKLRSFKSHELHLGNNSKTNDKINSHEVINGNKNGNKDNNKTETDCENIEIDLFSMFTTIEETIRLSQDALLNIDQFLPNDDEKDVTVNDTGTKKEGGWVCNPGIEWEKKVADPMINIGEQEQVWSTTIDSMLSTHTRRKRRLQSGAPLPISSFVISRTPYDMPLLLSPLSQYEDRFMGTIIGDKNVLNPDSINNKGLSYEERKTVERCRIQSCAASAETRLRHLALANIEWSKQLNESKNALLRAEAVHEQAVQDDLLESKYIRKELISHGIAQSNPNDPPLSPLLPIETLRNNNLVNENTNKVGNFPQKGVTKRGCITINSKKNPIVHIQNYKAAAAAAANMIANETNSEEVIPNTEAVIETKKTTSSDNKPKGGRRR